jgi:3-hexulose-6-phosphate synthase/6-phospho-3-hexuloisomerase
MYPIVQVSLDVTSIQEALYIARRAVRAGVDWLEAGTPLILAEGLRSVEALKKEFPDKVIVADIKNMDAGGLEGVMAIKAGADVFVVMAAAHDATIKEAVKVARKYRVKVMADLLAIKDKPKRAKELVDMGVDYIMVHTGYDERNNTPGASPIEDLPDVLRVVNVPVQAAGGLTVESTIETVRMGAKLVIIGAPIVVKHDRFEVGDERFEEILKEIVRRIKT